MVSQAAIFNHMVEDLMIETDAVFHALAHGVRRDMLVRLARSDLTVGELAEPLDMSFAAASKHVKVLENARLVQRQVHGRNHIFHLQPDALMAAQKWFNFYERFWNERLDALESVFDHETKAVKSTKRKR